MKRVALAVITTLGLILALLVVTDAPAVATAPTTIAGPDQVGYYANVTVTGTAAPGAKVAVYFRVTGRGSFVARRTVATDSAGRWDTEYYAASDDEYYAIADGVRSPTHRTAVVTATCVTSGPAFTKLPVIPAFPHSEHFAAFTTTRNNEWAGVAFALTFTGGDFAVIAWRPGHPLSTVAKIHYANTGTNAYGTGTNGAVQVAGITPSGAIVASVQVANSTPGTDKYAAFAWSGGRRYTLTHAPSWTSFAVTGVSDRGVIAGWASTETSHGRRYYTVRWASPTAPYKVLAATGNSAPSVVIDGQGDIAYADAQQNPKVVLADGADRVLEVPHTLGAYPLAAAGSYIYGQGPGGTFRWDIKAIGSGPVPEEVVTARNSNEWVQAAGPGGEFVDGLNPIRQLRTSAGAYVRMPAEYTGDGTMYDAGNAIDAHGRVAYTSATDGLPHFLTCRTVDAQDGRPVVGSTAADVDGDGRADLLATRRDGSLWYYRNTGNAAQPYSTGRKIGASGWGGFRKIDAADVNGDQRADLVAVRPDGTLWYYRNSGSATHPYSSASKIGSGGWNGFTKLAAADVNGDQRADLVAVRPDGTLWYYRNTGSATHPYSSASKIGSGGWNGFDKLALADVDGDHRADVIATRADGTLWYYRNTGSASHPYGSASRIGTSGWNAFDKLVAGDTAGDGHADLLVTRPAGMLSLYRNTQSPSRPFADRSQIGLTGWQAFDRLF